MRLRFVLMVSMVLALAVGVATATPGNGNGGNSAATKACQRDGWKTLVRSDGSAFKNQGDCVSYAAQGGTLTKTQSQLDCESFGGTFSTDPTTDQVAFGLNNPVLWTCNGASEELVPNGPVAQDCFHTPGGYLFVHSPVAPFDSTCYGV